MFPETFDAISGNYSKSSHAAIMFQTRWNEKDVIKALLKSIDAFIRPDTGSLSTSFGTTWKEGRLTCHPTIYGTASCCSFSKTKRWYLYPIHIKELAPLGLTEDDLVKYIKYLNDLKCGFSYLYLGQQTVGSEVNRNMHRTGMEDATYYWVCVPEKNGVNQNWFYSHWIHLRYLINTTNEVGNATGGASPYYLFPRIMFYLNEKLRVSKWKSFMYAYAAKTWYYYYGIMNGTAQDITLNDLGITNKQFEQLIASGTHNGSMNELLTITNRTRAATLGITLNPRHIQSKSFALFKKDPKEFVKYMRSCYPEIKPDVKNAKKITRGKKTAAKA